MTTGAILAGGKSVRMGFNKALINTDGEAIIARTIRLFKGIFDATFIVANDVLLYEGLDTPVFADIYKGAASLGGVYTALFHSKDNYTFVAACDMPLLDPAAIRKVLSSVNSTDACVPFINGQFHPMHAAYSKRCLKPIEEMIKSNDLRIHALFEKIRVKKLCLEDFNGIPVEKSVENVNTREDLKRLGLSV